MKLHKILEQAGGALAIIGCAGIAGAIETREGLPLSVLLLAAGVIMVLISLKEGGNMAKHESDNRYYGDNPFHYSIYDRKE